MLTVARTLMGNPRLLLLDEPSEGLAPVIVRALADQIAALKREGLTILLSEQNSSSPRGWPTAPTSSRGPDPLRGPDGRAHGRRGAAPRLPDRLRRPVKTLIVNIGQIVSGDIARPLLDGDTIAGGGRHRSRRWAAGSTARPTP